MIGKGRARTNVDYTFWIKAKEYKISVKLLKFSALVNGINRCITCFTKEVEVITDLGKN